MKKSSQRIIGSLWFLNRFPAWLVFLIAAIGSTGMVGTLRIIFEGRWYDYSRASLPGDLFLALYFGIVSELCKEDLPEGFYLSWAWHIVTFLLALSAAMILEVISLLQGGGRAKFTLLPANLYHFIVVLVFGYAIVSSLPIIGVTKNRNLKLIALGCLAIYLGLLSYDMIRGNLNYPYIRYGNK